MAINVCIVDDNKDILQALEQVVQLSDACLCIGSYTSEEEAIKQIPVAQPHIVLMDINLGSGSGINCVRVLKPLYPQILYMMCTVYEEDEKIFEALNAGASGYILKKTAPDKLLEAIIELHQGGAPMSSQIARKVVTAFQNNSPVDHNKTDNLSSLSNRELEILEHLSRGMLYKEIAGALFISSETVRKHVYHIYEKLHVNNRIEAINKFFGR